ncbi:uncharacterized protein VNE69_01037 [Vairimorpha necatrix]|uniref:Uncharacterized protein n=1 Tax=Vairimorpha necatrix TaxID=6039 RepID=A0AAX4J840_9MICR
MCCKNGKDIYGCSEKRDIIQAEIRHIKSGLMTLWAPKHNNRVFFPEGYPNVLTLWENHAGLHTVIDVVWFKDEEYLIMQGKKCYGYNEKNNNFNESKCFQPVSLFKIKFENDERDDVEEDFNPFKDQEGVNSAAVHENWPFEHEDSSSHKKRQYNKMEQ